MTYQELKEVMLSYHLGNVTRQELKAAFALYQLKQYGEVMEC